jgi:ADP-ribose pyrophosphatase YjhB (NUDIX family)
MLLARRGPESKPAEEQGRWAGVGGKVDVGEYSEEALVRELKEEIGFDASQCSMVPVATKNLPDSCVTYYVVYADSMFDPQVPASEANKVCEPTWFPLDDLPHGEMMSGVADATTAALPYARGKRLAGADPLTKWIVRTEAGIPDEFDIAYVNNRDRMCTAYAIDWQLRPEDRLDFTQLGGLLATRPGGFYPQDLVDEKKYSIGVWDTTMRNWYSGGPDCDILLMYTANGTGGHYDALKRRAPNAMPTTSIIYPQGRCSWTFVSDKRLHTQPHRQGEALDPANDAVALLNPTPLPPINRGASVAGARPIMKAAVATPSLPSTINRPGASADGPYTDTGFVLGDSPSALITQIAADRRGVRPKVPARDDIYRPVVHEQAVTFAPPTQGIISFLRTCFIDIGIQDFEATATPDTATVHMTTYIRAGGSVFPTHSMIDLTAGEQRSLAHITDNLSAVSPADRYSQIVKDHSLLWPALNSSADAASFANILGAYDDSPNSSMAPYFERLLAGALAAATGAVAGPPPPAAPPNGYSGLLFPNLDLQRLILANVPIPAPVGGVPPPLNAFYPQSLFERGGRKQARTNYTLLGHRTQESLLAPPVTPNRDYRAALFSMSRPYLGLDANANVNPAHNAAGFDERRRHAFTAAYRHAAPYLMVVAMLYPAPQHGLANLAAAANPQSWLDACAFLLHNWGGSPEFALGMQNAVRRGARFFHPTVTELPTDLEVRTCRLDLFTTLRRRITYLRVISPTATAAPAHAAGSWSYTRWVKAMIAVRPAQDLSSAHLAANAADLALVVNILPGLTVANTPEYNPVAAPPDSTSDDALWHQFFAAVTIDGADDEIFRDFVSAMPHAMLQNMYLWLAQPFHAAYNIAAALPNAASFTVTYTQMNGRVAAPAGQGLADLLRDGLLHNRAYSLPVTNLYESYNVTYPAGISHMRSLRPGNNNWHNDGLGMEIAPHLLQMTGEQLVVRASAIALQWRCATDAAANDCGLSPAWIATRNGIPTTGNTDFDNLVLDTSQRPDFGPMQPTFDHFLSAVSEGICRTGYVTNLQLDHTTGASNFHFPSYTRFWYPQPNAPRGRDNYLPLVVWRCLHPVLIQTFMPGQPMPGLPIKEALGMLALPTRASEAPWTTWDFEGTDLDRLEALAALRTSYAISGVAITPQLLLTYLGLGGARLTYYEVAHTLSRRPGRLSDTLSVTPTAIQDPLLWLSCPRKLNLEHRNANNDVSYLRPHPAFYLLAAPRINSSPPMRTYKRATLGASAAQPLFPTLGWVPVGMVVAIPAITSTMAGLNATPLCEYVDGNSEPTIHGARIVAWAGLQHSSNYQRMRSEASYQHFDPVLDNLLNTSPVLTTYAGVPVPAGYFPIALHNAASLSRIGAIVSYVPLRPIQGPAGAAITNIAYLDMLNGPTWQRLETVRLKATVIRPPFVITDRVQDAPTAEAQDLGSVAERGLFSVMFKTPYAQYLSGLGSAPDVWPAAPVTDKTVSYSQPLVVDKNQFDYRHLMPGWSALNTSTVPAPMPDPREFMTATQRDTFESYLIAQEVLDRRARDDDDRRAEAELRAAAAADDQRALQSQAVQDMLDFFTRQRQQGTEAAPTTPAPPTDTPNPARATPPVAPPPLPHLPLPGQGMHIASRVTRLIFRDYLKSIKTDEGTQTVSSEARWCQIGAKGGWDWKIRPAVCLESL